MLYIDIFFFTCFVLLLGIVDHKVFKPADKRLQETKKKDELFFQQARSAQIGEMIGLIVHQWRQPLSVIAGASQYYKRQYDRRIHTDESTQEFIDQVDETVDHLNTTINDFRNFFDTTWKSECFYLEQVIDHMLNLRFVSHDLKDNKIQTKLISSKPDNTSFQVCGVINELQQTLITLLKNSRDAFHQRSISSDKYIYIFVDYIPHNSEVIVSVVDNAGGIPSDIIPQVFDKNFTTKEEEGTGLGLDMAKQIIQEHMNGSIDIKNIKWPDSDTYTSIQLMDFIPQSNIDQDYDSGQYGAMFCIKFPLRIIDENEQLLEKI